MFKRPHLLALALAVTGSTATATDEVKLALDAALAASTAKDCGPDAMDEFEDDPDKPGEKRKKVAKDGNTPMGSGPTAGPTTGEKGKALDAAAMDAALNARGFITKADAEKLASDAATTAVARVNALHQARQDVEPLVGLVAMDSADAVYEFALKKEGIALDGVPAAAYPALLQQVKARKLAGVAAVGTRPQLAQDAISNVSNAIPGLGRFALQ
jgi:hypothetical protein